MQLKFIHAADLHLGSPFKGLSGISPKLGDRLRKASFDAYDRLIKTAISEKVDFVLIAGDSFDSGSGDLRAQYRFVSGMQQLRDAEIPVYLITGNHDPLDKWSDSLKLPDNVFRFSGEKPETYTFTKKGEPAALIIGMSYAQQEVKENLTTRYPDGDRNLLSIALLHGNFGSESGHQPYSPFGMDDLRRKSEVDYWALGHIHKREVISDQSPLAVYPGNIQGRHFNEEGDKGCYLVEYDGKKCTELDFVPLSDFIFKRVTIDCNGIGDLGAFSEMTDELVRQWQGELDGKNLLLKPTLSGMTELFVRFQNQEELDELIDSINGKYAAGSPVVYFERPANRTLPVLDLEERKQSNDFFADLLRDFSALLTDQSEADEIIAEINQDLKGSNRRLLSDTMDEMESEEEMEELIKNARNIAVAGILKQKANRHDH
jgi:DNA repair protein SbcD/Mre11